MTSPTDTPTPAGTAVAKAAKPLSPAAAEAKALREMTVAIRGQQWGASCSPAVQWAVARYCLRNGLDAVRHVEVLGGRLYLTAEFYREQGAELLLDGTITPDEPQLVHHEDRLDVLAMRDDAMGEWAKAERDARIKLRIQYGVDEDSPGAAVIRFRLKSGAILIGCNWVQGSGGKKKDPVGQAEPVKTAITRAERRAWRQVVEAIPQFREKVQPIEVSAKVATQEVAELVEAEVAKEPSKVPNALGAGGYSASSGEGAESVEELAPIDEAERLRAIEADAGRTPEDDEFEKSLDR